MDDGLIGKFWEIVSQNRDKTKLNDIKVVIEVLQQQKLNVSIDDLYTLCPLPVVDFITNYLSELKIQSILDPWANIGTLILSLIKATHAQHSVGISREPRQYDIARAIDTKNNVKWLLGDPLNEIEKLRERFDVIASFPPLGMNPKILPLTAGENPIEIHDNTNHLIILKSCLLLSDEGLGIFTVSPSFINTTRANNVFSNLTMFDLYLDAYIALPPRVFAPLTSVPAALILIRKGKSDSLFVGELSESPEQNKTLWHNLQRRKDGKEISLGKLVATSSFKGYQPLVAMERISRLASQMGLRSAAFSEIVREINLTKSTELPGFDERANSIYLPLIGRSNAVTSLSDLTLKPHNYAQLIIDTEKADVRYLAGLLNTPLGHAVRESAYSGSFIAKITKSSLLSMPLFLPAKEAQIQTIEIDSLIKSLLSELSELRNQTWSRPNQLTLTRKQVTRVNKVDRFIDWLDSLPFPLASILWSYNAARENNRLQYDYLDHFFEALAEFLATLLLSAFVSREDLFIAERIQLVKILKTHHLSLEKSSFGTWVRISERLSKRAREMANGKDRSLCKQMFSISDDDILEAVLSSKLVGVLQETNNLRNDWRGHGGVTSEQSVRERNVVLQTHLNEVRDCFGEVLSRYQLITPYSMKLREGVYRISAYRLMGTRTPFESSEFSINEPLETDLLYMIGEEERSALRLLPFIKISSSPESAQNACYFYNRKQKDGLRFVSYHFDARSEVIEPSPAISQAIGNILGTLENNSIENST